MVGIAVACISPLRLGSGEAISIHVITSVVPLRSLAGLNNSTSHACPQIVFSFKMSADSLLLAGELHSRKTRSPGRASMQLKAILDDRHLTQLEESPSHLYYEPDFQLAGEELGVDPPTILCEACRNLMRDPPKLFKADARNNSRCFPKAEYWVPHHSTFFELIECCYSSQDKCHMCHLFWHAFQRTASFYRREEIQPKILWQKYGLEVCLVEVLNWAGKSDGRLFLNVYDVSPDSGAEINTSHQVNIALSKDYELSYYA